MMGQAGTVAVVDDSPLALEMTRRALEQGGFAVVTASTIAELEAVFAREAPDLLLVDVNMPEMYGDDVVMVLKRVRRIEIPILALLEPARGRPGGPGRLRRRGRVHLQGRGHGGGGAPGARHPEAPMMEELRRRFLPRFLAMGHERTQRAREACETRLDLAAAELHALAGEAALLGLGQIDSLARRGERAARAKVGADCVRALVDIEVALAAMATDPTAPVSR